MEEEVAAHFQENVEHIVNFRPNGLNIPNDYSYNSIIKTQDGKIVDQIWAGPSHWKFKYIRPSSIYNKNYKYILFIAFFAVARFSGKCINEAETGQQKRKRTDKVASATILSFSIVPPDNSIKLNTKKKKKIECEPYK